MANPASLVLELVKGLQSRIKDVKRNHDECQFLKSLAEQSLSILQVLKEGGFDSLTTSALKLVSDALMNAKEEVDKCCSTTVMNELSYNDNNALALKHTAEKLERALSQIPQASLKRSTDFQTDIDEVSAQTGGARLEETAATSYDESTQLHQEPQKDDIDAAKELNVKRAKIELGRKDGYRASPISGHEGYQYDCHISGIDEDDVCVIKCWRRNPHSSSIDRRPVAIKSYRRGQPPYRVKQLRREVLAWKKVKSHCVTALHEVFPTETHVCLAFTYMRGGTLFEYIRDHPEGLMEEEAKRLFRDIVIGLRDLHHADIANRDIKTQNVILDETKRNAKIYNLGFARLESASCVTKLGTPFYQAPEIWNLSIDDRHNPRYDGKRVDVWSLGVLTYMMLFGTYPFYVDKHTYSTTEDRALALREMVLRGVFFFPESKRVSNSCKNIIYQMLTVDPEKRITIEEILQHPWFLRDAKTNFFENHPAPENCPYQSSAQLISIIYNMRDEESVDMMDE